MNVIHNHAQLKNTVAYKRVLDLGIFKKHVDLNLKTLVFNKKTYFQVSVTPINNNNNAYLIQYPFTINQFSKIVAKAAHASHGFYKSNDPNQWKPNLMAKDFIEECIVYKEGYALYLNDNLLSILPTRSQAEEMEKVFIARSLEKCSSLTINHFK